VPISAPEIVQTFYLVVGERRQYSAAVRALAQVVLEVAAETQTQPPL